MVCKNNTYFKKIQFKSKKTEQAFGEEPAPQTKIY
jgi:hypothetical protein